MKTFKRYLCETVDKNTHLEHVEDLLFLRGLSGAQIAVDILTTLTDMFSGEPHDSIEISIKWDGSPSIICGTNPENGKFFIATKSIFNKTPKLNYTQDDVVNNHSGYVATALLDCLAFLPSLNIEGILQGDLLFTKKDIKPLFQNNEKFVSFRRNVLTYAVPAESAAGMKISSCDLGVAFHTKYVGTTINNLRAQFLSNPKLSSSNIWLADCSVKFNSNSPLLLNQESTKIRNLLNNVRFYMIKLSAQDVSVITDNSALKILISRYVNSCVKDGISSPSVSGLTNFIQMKYKNDEAILKTDRGRLNKQKNLQSMVEFLNTHASLIQTMFSLFYTIVDCKTILLHALSRIEHTDSFLDTPEGMIKSPPEGFVISDATGNVVKLIDRMVFSRANFNLAR